MIKHFLFFIEWHLLFALIALILIVFRRDFIIILHDMQRFKKYPYNMNFLLFVIAIFIVLPISIPFSIVHFLKQNDDEKN